MEPKLKAKIRAGLLYEMAQNSSWPVTGLGNKGPQKVLNGAKLILDDHGNNLDSFRLSLESFGSIRVPLTTLKYLIKEYSFIR